MMTQCILVQGSNGYEVKGEIQVELDKMQRDGWRFLNATSSVTDYAWYTVFLFFEK